MSDVENDMDLLQRKLATKTREIEALVEMQWRAPTMLGCEPMSKELIYKWQQANVQSSGSNPDTALNRLIAEREEIEQQTLESDIALPVFLPGVWYLRTRT